MSGIQQTGETKASANGLPLLQVNDLTVNYINSGSAQPAVRDVSFEIYPGTTVGIIGESGAGKSSLALALMGLHDMDRAEVAGEVLFASKNLLAMSEAELCRVRGAGIGMIFQDPAGALDPAMKIEAQVAEVIQLHGNAGRREARQLARNRLAEVGLTEEVLAVAPYAHQLSGGLCQRAMIAATLACGPAVLIADEPTSALDVTLQAQIISILNKQCRDNGLAVVFISHDLALVSSFADELIVLHEGEVVEKGNCDKVMAEPHHPYTSDLISFWQLNRIGGRPAHAAP